MNILKDDFISKMDIKINEDGKSGTLTFPSRQDTGKNFFKIGHFSDSNPSSGINDDEEEQEIKMQYSKDGSNNDKINILAFNNAFVNELDDKELLLEPGTYCFLGFPKCPHYLIINENGDKYVELEDDSFENRKLFEAVTRKIIPIHCDNDKILQIKNNIKLNSDKRKCEFCEKKNCEFISPINEIKNCEDYKDFIERSIYICRYHWKKFLKN